jgi:hypothetical protein
VVAAEGEPAAPDARRRLLSSPQARIGGHAAAAREGRDHEEKAEAGKVRLCEAGGLQSRIRIVTTVYTFQKFD